MSGFELRLASARRSPKSSAYLANFGGGTYVSEREGSLDSASSVTIPAVTFAPPRRHGPDSFSASDFSEWLFTPSTFLVVSSSGVVPFVAEELLCSSSGATVTPADDSDIGIFMGSLLPTRSSTLFWSLLRSVSIVPFSRSLFDLSCLNFAPP